MIEYAIINKKTGLILDSFASEDLAKLVLKDYKADGYDCYIQIIE